MKNEKNVHFSLLDPHWAIDYEYLAVGMNKCGSAHLSTVSRVACHIPERFFALYLDKICSVAMIGKWPVRP